MTGSQKSSYRYGAASVSNGTVSDFKSSGPANPDIAFGYKAFDQSDTKIVVNLGYRPTVTKAKGSTTTSDGNNAQPQSRLRISARYLRTFGDAEFEVSLARNQLSNGSSENATTSTTTDYSGGHSTEIGFVGQKYFNENFFGGGVLMYEITEPGTTDSSGTKTDYGGATVLQLGVAGGAEFSQSSFFYLAYMVGQPFSQEVSSGAIKLIGEVGSSSRILVNYSYHF